MFLSMFIYFFHLKDNCAGLRKQCWQLAEQSLERGLSLRSVLSNVSGNIGGITGNSWRTPDGIREAWDSIKEKRRSHTWGEAKQPHSKSIEYLIFFSWLTALFASIWVNKYHKCLKKKKKVWGELGKGDDRVCPACREVKNTLRCWENERFFKQEKK